MGKSSLKDKSLKILKRALTLLPLLFKKTIRLFRKRDLVIIAFFTLLGIGGVFAAGVITLTQGDTQGAGYAAVTSCDPNVTINKNISFDLTLNRYVISTISITDIDQRYGAGCGNLIMELALPMNGDVTYASWTIPSSTITNGVFTYGANNSTGITYRAYTPLTPIDVEYSFASAAIAVRPSTRTVTNGPVYDLLKDNGFTTVGQSNSSTTLTFALSLSCGTLTVDTTQSEVNTALSNLAAPTGYVTNNATSTGVNGATSAAYLGFRGTLANINTVLPWIYYSWKSDCTNPAPTFQAAIWDALSNDNPVAWNFPGNGHYYQLIKTLSSSAPSWDQSFLEITGMSANYNTAALPTTTRSYASCNYKVFGMCGYFATVSSQAENNFIYSKKLSTITISDVKKIALELLTLQENTFFQYRNLLPNAQWKLLIAVAKEENVTQVLSGAFIQKYNLISASSVQRSLTALLEKELIYFNTSEEKPYYQVYDKFLMRWMQHSIR